MAMRFTRWLASGMVALVLMAAPVSAGPGAQAAEARLSSLGYTPAEAHAKLAGLTDEEATLVASDPSMIQVGGIDTGQAIMLTLVATLFLTMIFIVFA